MRSVILAVLLALAIHPALTTRSSAEVPIVKSEERFAVALLSPRLVLPTDEQQSLAERVTHRCGACLAACANRRAACKLGATICFNQYARCRAACDVARCRLHR